MEWHRFLNGLALTATLVAVAACGGGDDATPANQAPVAAITAPAAGSTFRAGDSVAFAGTGTDPEEGALAGARLTWWAELHHAGSTRPFMAETAGLSGRVTIPTRGETSDDIFYRFHLRATDGAGATHETTRDIHPQKAQVTVTTDPPGLALVLDGRAISGPTSFTGVVGIERTLGAAATQNSGGANARRYEFVAWSDGGEPQHTIATPAAATTYTARYRDLGPVDNTPPTVTLSAPAGATAGVAVTLVAQAADGDGAVTGVEFLEDGATIATDTTAPYSVTWTPTAAGVRTLTARATDDRGASTSSAGVAVTVAAAPANQAPVATIGAPAAGASFRAGAVIAFAGSATDAEDGPLAAGRLTWWAVLHHPGGTRSLMAETTGRSGQVLVPAQGETAHEIFVRVHLRATDSAGARHEVTRDVQPRKVQVTLATQPAGLALALDGQAIAAPTTFTGVVGIERTLGAAATQNSSGANARRYQFLNWSDGGAANHTVATPAADTTYTANYQDLGPVNNAPPTVALTAPANGSSATAGVVVNLVASAADGDGTVAGVEFFENGVKIGATDTSAPYGVAWTPGTLGVRTLSARVADNLGASTTSASVSVTVNAPPNQAPTASITLPAAGATFRAGVPISFAGSGTDAEDGALAAGRLTWWAELHHASHTHPLLPATTGAGGTLTFPTRGHTEDDIFIRLHLRATDSAGATREVTRDIQPQKVQLTLATSPAGLALTLDGQPVTGPHTVTGVVGIERDLVAAATQNSSGANARRYQFLSWSDGGAATHTVATPAASTTYTANYQDVGPVNNTPPTVALTAPANNSSATAGVLVNLVATAADSDGNVTGVEFFENGVKIGATDTGAPYGVVWTPATPGVRSLTARATDDQGASTGSAAISVTVDPPANDVSPPVATLTAPANLATNLMGTLTLTATATDNVGVVSMEFQVDGEQVGGGLDTTAPYSVTVNSSLYASGQHVVRARARDAAGNVSLWASATVLFGGSRTQPSGFTRSSSWASGLSSATAFAQAPDGRWFVAEQGGALRIVASNGALQPMPFMTLAVDANGERGLIGVALHPGFASNRWVYVYHTTTQNGTHNRISRYTASSADPNVVDAGSPEVRIADLPALSGATNHNGGAMHFGADGKLYVAVGDNANSAKAPNLNDPFGKLLRFNDDGSIPTDNPHYAAPATLIDAIWARGLRNPFTFAVRVSDGRIHVNDVGEGTWEEVNVGAPGANYGWPSTEGPTTAVGITAPLYAYDHDAGSSVGGFFSGCAITGGAFYNASTAFPATYRNSYYFADYCSRFVGRVDLAADSANAAYSFGAVSGDPVDMRVGVDGALYVLTRGSITRFSAP